VFEWIIAALSGCVVLRVTPAVIRLGNRFNWVDNPDARKQHKKATVRVGGIGICLGMLVSVAGLLLVQGTNVLTLSSPLFAIAIGSFLSFSIGFADDVFGLSPILRLGLQAIVTFIVWSLGIQIEALPIPFLGTYYLGWLSLPLTFLWLAGVANAINWVDGLDGLAAGTVAIASAALAMVCYQLNHFLEASLAISLTAALLGFLYHNAKPAKLFMGDGGAYLIGFLWASLAISGVMSNTSSQIVLCMPYLLLLVPIGDMVYVILSRVSNGKSPFYPDRCHLHHRLLGQGSSYEATVAQIYIMNIVSGGLAIAITNSNWPLVILIALSAALFAWPIPWSPQTLSADQKL
jgi:UDP-GlcNAc:undecaprenyl-phosphate GlcNAc-1-phosphate transferase